MHTCCYVGRVLFPTPTLQALETPRVALRNCTQGYSKKPEKRHQTGNNLPEFWLVLLLKTRLNSNET